ncbi:MAG: GntR family transcriptional regulator [Candidatus Lindowbacteria bacterium]|nr:GntR family transcriptional regulator [Candidatus Lindowbacteria bacterium]
MLPRIDPTKSEPIYLQLMNELKYSIASGMTEPGEILPSVREMALRLRINPNTVARAYRELEHEGVVVTRAGKGVFVSDVRRNPDKRRALAEIKNSLDGILVEAYHRGVSLDEVRALLDGRIESLNKTRAK